MQKTSLFFLLTFYFCFSACNTGNKADPTQPTASTDTVNIFPVTSFLKAQLKELDTLPITPLLIITAEGKADSSWLKREDIRKQATPFLSPEIDSASLHSFFTEKSFLDQTINSYTFSYDAKPSLPDSIQLIHWDVYMNPQTHLIERIYLVKEKDSAGNNITTQLTWVVNKYFNIRDITQSAGREAQVNEKKMIWNFED